MTKISLFLNLILRSVIWGVILGVFFGIIYHLIFFGLAFYGIVGVVYGLLAGCLLGIINGVVLGTLSLTSYLTTDNEAQYKHRTMITSVIVTFAGGFLIFYFLLYPWAQSFGGTVFLTIPAASVAAFAAAYASQRLSAWYITQSHRKSRS